MFSHAVSMMRQSLTLGLVGLVSTAAWAAGDFPTFLSPREAGFDYAVQGEYAGRITTGQAQRRLGVQVIALGEGKFRGVVYYGGLPGQGWERGKKQEVVQNESPAMPGSKVTLGGASLTLEIDAEGKTLSVLGSGGDTLGTLKKTIRKSPTLEAAAPQGAVVLFDGQGLEQFNGGILGRNGLLMTSPAKRPAAAESKPGDDKPAEAARPAARAQRVRADAISKQSFGDFTLHLEFRTPFMPTATGQARGNSGVYLQNRYEVQVLDSFGLEGLDNECGGIYKASQPRVNMCLPPLVWQTYDIDFRAPRFDDEGNKTANARVSVKHNGVAIHEDLELPAITPGGDNKEGPTGPLKLQDHGNPVQFRNIWVVM